MSKYQRVKVRGVDKDGHKELFDDFIGELINVDEKGKLVVSEIDGPHIWHVDRCQVSFEKEPIILPRIIRVDLTISEDDKKNPCLPNVCPYKTSSWSCGVFGELPDAKRHQKCIDAESVYLTEHYRNG